MQACRKDTTVSRFCEQERVSVHTFYYWAKRVGSTSVRTPAKGPVKASQGGPQFVKHAPTAGGISNTALVRFHWNAAVEVSVPADCLDAIRCLAECLQHARVDRSDAFQEVVVSS
jgi:hypothetical protein